MKAIILAGGLGERLRPLTNHTPKPLLLIQNRPILQWCIENLKNHRIDEIILSVGYKANKIQDYFEEGTKFGVNIEYNIEEAPLGTGGAVKQIIKKFGINEEFILVWGDNLANFDFSEMIKTHKEHLGLITMALTPREDVENFGVAHLNENQIRCFVEKPRREAAPSNLINAGAFIIHPPALGILPEGKSSIERECFELLALEGKIYAHEHKGYWFPTDTLKKYNFAEEKIKGHLVFD